MGRSSSLKIFIYRKKGKEKMEVSAFENSTGLTIPIYNTLKLKPNMLLNLLKSEMSLYTFSKFTIMFKQFHLDIGIDDGHLFTCTDLKKYIRKDMMDSIYLPYRIKNMMLLPFDSKSNSISLNDINLIECMMQGLSYKDYFIHLNIVLEDPEYEKNSLSLQPQRINSLRLKIVRKEDIYNYPEDQVDLNQIEVKNFQNFISEKPSISESEINLEVKKYIEIQ